MWQYAWGSASASSGQSTRRLGPEHSPLQIPLIMSLTEQWAPGMASGSLSMPWVASELWASGQNAVGRRVLGLCGD